MPGCRVGHISAHELVEAGDGEVDVAIDLGRVRQSFFEQPLTGSRYLGGLHSELGRDVPRAIWTFAELRHRSHIATLAIGDSLDTHLIDAGVQRRLCDWHRRLNISP